MYNNDDVVGVVAADVKGGIVIHYLSKLSFYY